MVFLKYLLTVEGSLADLQLKFTYTDDMTMAPGDRQEICQLAQTDTSVS